ncbi:MAG: TIGR02996 domain-containing protein [Gemmataceae bacterium]
MDNPLLLQAIRADPRDDLARLAYADWLEENGDPERGELIRLQIALRESGRSRGETVELLRRLRTLLIAHQQRWLGPLAWAAPDSLFDRGFVHKVRVRAADLLRCGDELLAMHPIVHLTVADVSNEIWHLTETPLLADVPEVELQLKALPPDAALALAGSPYLGRITVLDMRRSGVGPDALAAVAASTALTALHTWLLGENGLTDVTIAALVRALRLPHLERLDLSHNGISDAGAARIAEAAPLRRLKALLLRGNQISRDGIARLAGSPLFATMTLLDVSGNIPWRQANGLRSRYGPRLVV